MTKYSKILIPTIYLVVIGVMVMSVILVLSGVKSYISDKPSYEWTLDNVFEDETIPVVKESNDIIIRPYLSENIKVLRYFYDFESDDEKKQMSSLIVYGDTYMQNNGVDYSSDEDFDVIAILDGEVISVEDNEIYGKVVTIQHNDNLKTTYSNVKDVLVAVGYKVSQGEIIATSDKSKLDNNVNAMLHFEVSYKNNLIDPESLYTLSVSELQ